MIIDLTICQINYPVNSNQKKAPLVKKTVVLINRINNKRAIQVPLVKKAFVVIKKTHPYFHIIGSYHRSFSCECSWFSTLWQFAIIWRNYSSCYKKGKNENKLTIHQGNPWRLNVLIIKLFSLKILCSNLRKIKYFNLRKVEEFTLNLQKK
jgi:hypothetical protein